MCTWQDEYDCHVVARVFAKLINSLRTTGVQQILAHLGQQIGFIFLLANIIFPIVTYMMK